MFQTFPSAGVTSTDTTPTIFGTITDPIAGTAGVSSGPQSVAIQINNGNTLFSLATVNINQVTTGSESKYSTFSYTPSDPLPTGNYQVTMTGKDNAGNSGSALVFNLNIGTYSQVVTPEENLEIEKIILEENPDATPREREEIKEKLDIVQEVVPREPTVFEIAGQSVFDLGKNVVNGFLALAGNIISGTIQTIASLFIFTGQAIAFVWNQSTSALVFVGNSIGSGYHSLASNAPGVIGDTLLGLEQTSNNILSLTNNAEKLVSSFAGPASDQFVSTWKGYNQFVASTNKTIITFIGQTTQSVFNIAAAGLTNAGNGITSSYNQQVKNTRGFTKDMLIAVGNGVSASGNVTRTTADNIGEGVNDTTKEVKEGVANIAFNFAQNADGVSNYASNVIVQFGYLFATEPTRIKEVKVLVLSPTSFKVSWTTNHPATGKVNWGFDRTYPFELQTSKRTTKHEFALTKLKPNTRYVFEVMSQNKNYVYDANREFKTLK